MGKNDRDMRECVKHSLDARLSGLTSVPFLEQRVLAGEGKEKGSLKQHTKWPPRKGIGKNHPKRWRKEEGREAKGQKAGRQ